MKLFVNVANKDVIFKFHFKIRYLKKQVLLRQESSVSDKKKIDYWLFYKLITENWLSFQGTFTN